MSALHVFTRSSGLCPTLFLTMAPDCPPPVSALRSSCPARPCRLPFLPLLLSSPAFAIPNTGGLSGVVSSPGSSVWNPDLCARSACCRVRSQSVGMSAGVNVNSPWPLQSRSRTQSGCAPSFLASLEPPCVLLGPLPHPPHVQRASDGCAPALRKTSQTPGFLSHSFGLCPDTVHAKHFPESLRPAFPSPLGTVRWR